MAEKFDKGFFDWLREAAIKRMEKQIKAPWFYFDSCMLSPSVINSYGKIPWWWIDAEEGAIAFNYEETFAPKANHHLKIFLN